MPALCRCATGRATRCSWRYWRCLARWPSRVPEWPTVSRRPRRQTLPSPRAWLRCGRWWPCGVAVAWFHKWRRCSLVPPRAWPAVGWQKPRKRTSVSVLINRFRTNHGAVISDLANRRRHAVMILLLRLEMLDRVLLAITFSTKSTAIVSLVHAHLCRVRVRGKGTS